jgi:hypothetical protein
MVGEGYRFRSHVLMEGEVKLVTSGAHENEDQTSVSADSLEASCQIVVSPIRHLAGFDL